MVSPKTPRESVLIQCWGQEGSTSVASSPEPPQCPAARPPPQDTELIQIPLLCVSYLGLYFLLSLASENIFIHSHVFPKFLFHLKSSLPGTLSSRL